MNKQRIRNLSDFTQLDYMTIAFIVLAIIRAIITGNYLDDSIASGFVIIAFVLQVVRIAKSRIKL